MSDERRSGEGVEPQDRRRGYRLQKLPRLVLLCLLGHIFPPWWPTLRQLLSYPCTGYLQAFSKRSVKEVLRIVYRHQGSFLSLRRRYIAVLRVPGDQDAQETLHHTVYFEGPWKRGLLPSKEAKMTTTLSSKISTPMLPSHPLTTIVARWKKPR